MFVSGIRVQPNPLLPDRLAATSRVEAARGERFKRDGEARSQRALVVASLLRCPGSGGGGERADAPRRA